MTASAEKTSTTALHEGDTAPSFTLPTSDGSVSLEQFEGKQNVLLYFYPKDDTPGCTIQAKAARDLKPEFTKADTVVIGISKDDVASHAKFCSKYELTHILASDAGSDVCERYGMWGEKNMYGKKYMGILRGMVLIDKHSTIAKYWAKVSPEGSLETALKAAQGL